jgi:hypothetical protein
MGGPSPVLWGVLAALLRFIPYIGVWIAGLLACLLAAAVEPGWSMLMWTAGLFAVTEVIAGQIVEPLLYGHTTGLSPLSVVVSAIFWSWLWGPVGLLLSTPLTLCLVVMGRYVERLNFLEVLLGDKPQVTPAQQLYEHLADQDVEAALKQAEDMLQKSSATDYYDQVLVPALKILGEASVSRSLTEEHLKTVRSAAQELIGELGPHLTSGEGAKGPSTSRQVLLVAARGAMDDVLAHALKPLFAAHGVEVLGDGSSTLLDRPVETLDATRCHICVLAAAPARSASGVHLAARRAQQACPGIPLLTGIYNRDDIQASSKEGDELARRCSSVHELLRAATHA